MKIQRFTFTIYRPEDLNTPVFRRTYTYKSPYILRSLMKTPIYEHASRRPAVLVCLFQHGDGYQYQHTVTTDGIADALASRFDIFTEHQYRRCQVAYDSDNFQQLSKGRWAHPTAKLHTNKTQ